MIPAEIGSIFTLQDGDFAPCDNPADVRDFVLDDSENQGIVYHSLCRESLSVIAELCKDNTQTVLIPSYTCVTVIDPFVQKSWHCSYYEVTEDLSIDIPSLEQQVLAHKPALVIFHPYYGKDFTDKELNAVLWTKKQGCKVVVDLTQNIFSKQRLPEVDFYVGSYRKWMPVPDGAFMIYKKSEYNILDATVENEEFVSLQTDAMYLRGCYNQSQNQRLKEIAMRIARKGVACSYLPIRAHAMSVFSQNIITKDLLMNCAQKRKENYAFLFEKLKNNVKGFRLMRNSMDEINESPLYFPIYADDRSDLQAFLAKNKIYAPVIWPKPEHIVCGKLVDDIYQHILAIPCDQRYCIGNMEYVVDVLNKYIKQ